MLYALLKIPTHHLIYSWIVYSGLFSHLEDTAVAAAVIDGTGPGWHLMTSQDFVDVNGAADTWQWEGPLLRCTGIPVGVIRSRDRYANFELVLQWRHLRAAGNSGVFVWSPLKSLKDLPPGQLPHGIEVQVLDNDFKRQYEERTGKPSDWFTTHGDVFPVGGSSMKPFAPVSPDGSRSFPSQNLSRGVGKWNHYYIRCVNGEIRLWVNGQEVSGGTQCEPRVGYICLESEGSPVDFRYIRIRPLP